MHNYNTMALDYDYETAVAVRLLCAAAPALLLVISPLSKSSETPLEWRLTDEVFVAKKGPSRSDAVPHAVLDGWTRGDLALNEFVIQRKGTTRCRICQTGIPTRQ